MRKQHVVRLTDDDGAAPEQMEPGPLTRRQRYRVQILLRADAGDTDEEIAEEAGVSAGTVANVFNAWNRMPTLDDQARIPEALTADFTVVRALLKKGRSYDDALGNFKPYDRIREPNEGARKGMATIARWATPMKPAFLFVNNRLEGNAPSTIEAVAERLGP